MKKLYIENASAISPLGRSLDEIWNNVLSGETDFCRVGFPRDRNFFAAETIKNSTSNVDRYATLFNDSIGSLIESLDLKKPVDAIFFATAVGNLAYIENKVYSGQDIEAYELDFSSAKTIFAKTKTWSSQTRFICIPTGCCAGLQAAGLARSVMSSMGLKSAIIMALDFGLTPLGFMAFHQINATMPFDESFVSSPSRPFCRERGGFLFADGGGALLVTTEPSDESLPCISGYGCVSSAYHMTDIAVDGNSIKNSMLKALAEAQVSYGDIAHVNLHASGTQQNDTAEYQAMKDIFVEPLPTITAFKGNHGHALGGSNIIELALCWRMMRDRIIPPTPKGLSFNAYAEVPPRVEAIPFTGRAILKTASGFGGIHTSLVMEN